MDLNKLTDATLSSRSFVACQVECGLTEVFFCEQILQSRLVSL